LATRYAGWCGSSFVKDNSICSKGSAGAELDEGASIIRREVNRTISVNSIDEGIKESSRVPFIACFFFITRVMKFLGDLDIVSVKL
jgi:hypothetical protein